MELITTISEMTRRADYPSPMDFDKFVPWACSQLAVEADIFITRKTLKEYSNVAASDRSRTKSKPKSRQPSRSVSDTVVGSVDKTASIFALSVMDHDKLISIETVYDSSVTLVQIKFMNNRTIPRQLFKIIGLIISFYKNLSSIVINSGLRMDSMYELSKLLFLARITEICLDNTFLLEANYHVLLGHNSLKHLSLARCKINDAVVKTITTKLECLSPASNTLSALNLSSNRITDVGAIYLAQMLRSNRQISYLNVAGNLISDKGAISIFSVLDEFPLTAEELTTSTGRFVIYLRQKNELIATLTKALKAGNHWKRAVKKKSTKGKTFKSIGKESQTSLTAINIKRLSLQTDSEIKLREKAETWADSKLGQFIDPFSPNNCIKKEDVVFCLGNNALCYLNLAYNNLSYASIKVLHKVLWTQKIHNRTPKGLVNVMIEGNFIPATCLELDEINEMLTSYLDSVRLVRESMRRKSMYSRSGTK